MSDIGVLLCLYYVHCHTVSVSTLYCYDWTCITCFVHCIWTPSQL